MSLLMFSMGGRKIGFDKFFALKRILVDFKVQGLWQRENRVNPNFF
jgi:hypothetical protein